MAHMNLAFLQLASDSVLNIGCIADTTANISFSTLFRYDMTVYNV